MRMFDAARPYGADRPALEMSPRVGLQHGSDMTLAD